MLRRCTFLITLPLIIATGTVFFHYAENRSWPDSYFFTVVMLSIVGYVSLVPAAAPRKTGRAIFTGLGALAPAIRQFACFTARKREEHAQ